MTYCVLGLHFGDRIMTGFLFQRLPSRRTCAIHARLVSKPRCCTRRRRANAGFGFTRSACPQRPTSMTSSTEPTRQPSLECSLSLVSHLFMGRKVFWNVLNRSAAILKLKRLEVAASMCKIVKGLRPIYW